MIFQHLPTQTAALGLSPCLGRRTAQAWVEVATMQGDTPFSNGDYHENE